MDDLVNFMKTQNKELTVNHVVGAYSYNMAQAVSCLYEIQGLDPADPLHHFGVMLMEANKADKDRSEGLTLVNLLRNEGLRF
ncbi:hypothetical protein ACSBR1_028347 [Camellia fascicularis]